MCIRDSRQECLKELPFPYPYREGQKELAGNVYRSIARKRNLFIQAPTGVGKTLSTIYPSLKAMGEGHGEKLFYLTAKTITRSAVSYTHLKKTQKFDYICKIFLEICMSL